jgi:hypothetical protein
MKTSIRAAPILSEAFRDNPAHLFGPRRGAARARLNVFGYRVPEFSNRRGQFMRKVLIRALVTGLLAGATAAGAATSQDKPADLSGHLAFDVGSDTGRVETIAVTVGDGGRGPYKAILSGESSLPTHTIYRPNDLKPFGGAKKLPILAFANGGCRNSSGEFRNLLSDVASHGYLVVAIGPAGDALVAGSEGRLVSSKAVQLLDAADWAIKQNADPGSRFFQKIDITKVAVAGQSCGGFQAIEVSGDPRITTSIVLNSGVGLISQLPASPPAPEAKDSTADSGEKRKGEYGTGSTNTQNLGSVFDKMAQRYAPYAPPSSGALNLPTREVADKELASLHSSVLYIIGGPSDIAYKGASKDFEMIHAVPVAFLNQDVGHYPATYREPNGGDFSVAVTGWLDWQLKGDLQAKKLFVGSDCGLCKDPKWKVQSKNLN